MSYRILTSVCLLVVVGVVSAIVQAQDGSFNTGPRPANGSSSSAPTEPRQLRSVLIGPIGSGVKASSTAAAEKPQQAQPERTQPAPIVPPKPASTWSGTVVGPVRNPVTPSPAAGTTFNLRDESRGDAGNAVAEIADAKPIDGSTRRTVVNPRAREVVEKKSAQSTLLLSSEAPSLRVETQGPDAIVIGKSAEFNIALINDGTVAAQGIYVRVVLPSRVQVERAATKGGPVKPQDDGMGQQRLLWSVASIPAGGVERLQLKVKPTDSRPFELGVDWTVRPAAAVTQIRVQKPELELTLFGPKDVLYGKTAIFTIQLTNPGTGAAEDVVLDFLYGQQRLSPKTIGTIAAGEQTEIDVELTAAEAGQLRVAAVASGEGGLRAESNQEILVRRGELEVEVIGTPNEFAGTTTTYQVRIANKGTASATSVEAMVLLPPGAKPVGADDRAEMTETGCSWRIGTLSPGAERLLNVHCALTQAGANRCEARAQGDDDLSAAHAFVTHVEALADLKLIVNDPPGPTAVGKQATYELRIVNRGTKAAEQINVVAQFSEGVEPIKAHGGAADIVPGQVVFKPIPRVDPGQELVLTVIARADRKGNHRFRAQVTCAEPETRLVAEESTYYFNSKVSGTARKD